MKKLINLLLSISLLSSPVTSFAGDGREVTTLPDMREVIVDNTKEFKAEFAQALADPAATKAKVDKIIYDLDHLPEVIDDLIKPMSQAASNGLTEKIVLEIEHRYQAALGLMAAIMLDKEMPINKKKEILSDLAGAISQLLYRVLRVHGIDKEVPIEQLRRDGVMNAVLGALTEIGNDFRTVLSAPQAVVFAEVDNDGRVTNNNRTQRVTGVADRFRRDSMMLQMTQMLQETLYQVRDKMDDADIVESKFIPLYWGKNEGERFVALRESRLRDEKAARFMYFGAGLAYFLFPLFDFVGMMQGGRDENSLFVSSVLVLSTMTFVALAKSATISDRAVVELKKMLEIARGTKGVEPTRGKITGFWTRIANQIQDIKFSCQEMVSGRKKAGSS